VTAMNNDDALNESLSAVADGVATPADWARVNAAWSHDPGLRERWATWHAAGDGMRSVELPALHREPEALLAALHAQQPAPAVAHPRRRDWFAPAAVAAGFVAVALGVGTLRDLPAPDPAVTVARQAPLRSPALVGTSFAETAAGPRDMGVAHESPSEIIDWPQGLSEAPASQPHP
jgi:negative regulator of sigma E activity